MFPGDKRLSRDRLSRMPSSDISTTPTLLRAVGTRSLAASLFNVIVGAGIFVLPATVAGLVGAAAPVAYLTCAVAILLVTLCFAVAGSRVPEAGGSYAYIGAAFGPLAGFLGGVMVLLSDVLATASVATAFAAGVGAYAPWAGTPTGRFVVLAAVLSGLAALNRRGVTYGARFVEAITVAKLAPLVLFILAGLALRWHDVPAPAWPAADALGRATLILMFAFSGAETAMGLSGEVVHPSRTIPRALLIALGLVTCLYGAVQLVAAASLGPLLVTSTAAPLADAAGAFWGPSFRTLMLAATLISMFGYLSAVALATPRTLFAIGGGGVLPEALGRVHPRYRSPHVAIGVHFVLVLVIAVSGSFQGLVPAASVAVLVLYLTVCLAAWQLARTGTRDDGEPFTVPAVVPFLGAAVCLWLLAHASWLELGTEGAVLAVAVAVFAIRRGLAPR